MNTFRAKISRVRFASGLTISMIAIVALCTISVTAASAKFKDSRIPPSQVLSYFDGGKSYTLIDEAAKVVTLSSRPLTGRNESRLASMKVRRPDSVANLKVGGGRVAFEMMTNEYMEDLDTYRVYVIAGDKFVPLLTKPEKYATGVCGWSERLIAVGDDGRIIVEDDRVDGFDGKCEITRTHRDLLAVDAANVVTTLTSSDSPYGAAYRDYDDDSEDRDGAAFAFVGGLLISKFDDLQLDVTNLATGGNWPLPNAIHKRIWELSANGHLLNSQVAHKAPQTKLFLDLSNLSNSVTLTRPGRISYFHFCGDRVIEITRHGKATTEKRRPAHWRVLLRDSDGKPLRYLKRKLNKGTAFLGCDQQVALFNEASLRRLYSYRSVALRLGQ